MPIADIPVLVSDDVSHWLTTFNSFASNVNSAFLTQAQFSGILQAEGSTRLSGSLKVTSAVVMSSTLTVTSFATMSGNFSVLGSAAMSAATVTGSMTVSGTTTIKNRLAISNTLLTASAQMASNTSIYILDASNNTIGITLCATSETYGTMVIVKRRDFSENAVTINVSGGADQIHGSAAMNLASYGTAMLYSDGSAWHDFVS